MRRRGGPDRRTGPAGRCRFGWAPERKGSGAVRGDAAYRAHMRVLEFLATVVEAVRQRPRLVRRLQALAVVSAVAFCAFAVVHEWHTAAHRLEHANLLDLLLALLSIAAYYLVFILGWIRMLDAWGIRIGYRVALQSEMASMLAKYVPGGVWTPAARAVALRRTAGVTDTPTVIASVLIEAALSAIAGVIVLVVSLAWVHGVDAPLPFLVAFAFACALALHPIVFRWIGRRLLAPLGAGGLEPLPFTTMLTLLVFYCGTWIVAGAGLYFLVRSVGADPGFSTVAFLGGTSAVGAIAAVLAVFSPSGLGAREASMYGMLLAVTGSGAALGAVVLNRLAITLVEIALFAVGVAAWRWFGGRRQGAGPVALASTPPTEPRG
jgi:glycosyltransferase 2 family protein